MLATLLIALLLSLWTPDLDDATLHERYLAPGDQWLQVAGTRLRVREAGPVLPQPQAEGVAAAPPLLLLHGFADSLHTWQAWWPQLAQQRRVLAIDWPGHGLSPPDASSPCVDARALELVLALLAQRGIDRVDVLGHSLGGRVAARLAAEHPQRVRRLVLVAPAGLGLRDTAAGAGAGATRAAVHTGSGGNTLLSQVLPRPLLRRALASTLGDPEQLQEAWVDRFHDLLRAPGARQAMLECAAHGAPADLDADLLRHITAPALLLWGRLDAVLPAALAPRWLQALAPQAPPTAAQRPSDAPDPQLATRLQWLEGVGHLPQLEQPQQVLPLLLEFLRPTTGGG